MLTNLHLQHAIELAVRYHGSQVDKSGDLYILHPLRVMAKMDTIEERIIAVLHDILEDTIITEEYLLSFLPSYTVDKIRILTKKKEESYYEYTMRVRGDVITRKIKLVDIDDNLSYNRIVKLSEEQRAKLVNKYINAKLLLI